MYKARNFWWFWSNQSSLIINKEAMRLAYKDVDGCCNSVLIDSAIQTIVSSQIIPVCLVYDLQLITKCDDISNNIVMSILIWLCTLKHITLNWPLNEPVHWNPCTCDPCWHASLKTLSCNMHLKCCNLRNPGSSNNRLSRPTSELTLQFFHSEEIGCCYNETYTKKTQTLLRSAYWKMLKPLKDLWLSIVFVWHCTRQESIEIRHQGSYSQRGKEGNDDGLHVN